MSKPSLLVLQGKNNFRIPTYVESPAVRAYFNVKKAVNFKTKKGRSLPDLVYCQAYGPFHEAFDKCRELGVPYVIHAGGSPWLEMRGGRLRRTVETMRGARAVVCNSRHLYLQFGLNMPDAGNLRTLPDGLWGLDHTRLGPSPRRFEPKEDYSYARRPMVMMAMNLRVGEGRSTKWRGIGIMFEAVKNLETPTGRPVFICAGHHAANFPHLEEWSRLCDLRVHSSRSQDGGKDEWPEVLRGADVFAHPSMNDFWPRAVSDGMCAAMPCLVFDMAGTPEVGEEVIKVDPANPAAIRGALRALLLDESLRRDLGGRARAESLRRTEGHRGDYVKLLLEVLA